jgi:hypothetical protein
VYLYAYVHMYVCVYVSYPYPCAAWQTSCLPVISNAGGIADALTAVCKQMNIRMYMYVYVLVTCIHVLLCLVRSHIQWMQVYVCVYAYMYICMYVYVLVTCMLGKQAVCRHVQCRWDGRCANHRGSRIL